MADPRLDTDIVGQDAKYMRVAIDDVTITWDGDENGGSASVDLAVTLSAAGTIATAADGEGILGKLIKVEDDGYATVQVGGGMELPAGTAATLTLGGAIVGDLLVAAEGYIRVSDGSTAGEIIAQRGFIYDASDTDAVQVYL